MATPEGCVACGEHQIGSATGCVCEQGYTPSDDGACVPLPGGIGVACSETQPCTDSTFNYCQIEKDGSGYCTTSNCTSPTDCIGGYACDTSGPTSVCKRPPAGLGLSCTSNADCAGTEATYCDVFFSHICLVQGCTVAPNNCFTGWDCCDLTMYGVAEPLCIPAGACMTQ
jgi:hypothetical protein